MLGKLFVKLRFVAKEADDCVPSSKSCFCSTVVRLCKILRSYEYMLVCVPEPHVATDVRTSGRQMTSRSFVAGTGYSSVRGVT